nr:RING-finger domain-containing protein [Oceanusvirus sp.]
MPRADSPSDAAVLLTVDVCCICLEELDREIKTLSCGHQFHERCIREWDERLSGINAPFRCALCQHEGTPPTGRRQIKNNDAEADGDTPTSCCSRITVTLVLSLFLIGGTSFAVVILTRF